jgi:hypothetical protein
LVAVVAVLVVSYEILMITAMTMMMMILLWWSGLLVEYVDDD